MIGECTTRLSQAVTDLERVLVSAQIPCWATPFKLPSTTFSLPCSTGRPVLSAWNLICVWMRASEASFASGCTWSEAVTPGAKQSPLLWSRVIYGVKNAEQADVGAGASDLDAEVQTAKEAAKQATELLSSLPATANGAGP